MSVARVQESSKESATIEDIAVNRDYSKLRKAASSQSLSKLKEAIALGGWKAKDIDDNDAYNQQKGRQKQRQHASKSALHMAAWKGSLNNVKYLIEDVGCDINAYSKQEFSYGKTAIFFALTQDRLDITEYLLQKGAKVTIVNNKGQSVLSLAASHFKDSHKDSIIQTIQKLEKQQSNWWNFRASHSDGFEYGDLDPRFFNDRQLQESDVVTLLAINPTTKKTRKGGFLRRNPEATKWTNTCRGEKSEQCKKRTRKKDPLPVLSLEEKCELDQAWESLLASPISISSESFDRKSLLEILRLSDKQRSSWIPQATSRLNDFFGTENSIEMIEKAIGLPYPISQRHLQLLTKILSRLKGGEQEEDEKENHQHNESQPQNNICRSKPSFDSSKLWKMARSEVESLNISCLEEIDSSILTIPSSPIFVDTPNVLRLVLEKCSCSRLVAIDTEWHTPPRNNNGADRIKPKAVLSTLQVAFWNSREHFLSSYVVDLLQQETNSRGHSEYHQLATILVGKLLEACCDEANQELPLIMGFAIFHDLPVLERFLNEGNEERTRDGNDFGQRSPPRYPRVLDLQLVLAADAEKQYARRKTGLPGLKACVAKYSALPLSKDCQCSDWGMRPLSKAQLDYAGLDAAILLVLLAERSRERPLSPTTVAE